MKKLFLLLSIAVMMSGCYTYVEYDHLHNLESGKFRYRYQVADSPNVPIVDDKIITVGFSQTYRGGGKLWIYVFSELKDQSIFLTKAKITSEKLTTAFEINKEILLQDEVAIFIRTKNSGPMDKIVSPYTRGATSVPIIDFFALLKAATSGDMKVEVFYLDEVTNEEKSITFDIIKKHYKSLVPPT